MIDINKKKILDYISSNRLEDALQELKSVYIEYDKNIINELLSIEAQYHSLQREKRLGIISFSESSLTQNKITYSLLEILERIKESEIKRRTYEFNQYDIIRILFISTGYGNTNLLRLDQEIREIESSLMLSKNRQKFKLTKIFASRIGDLIEGLSEYKPQFVHFSGHGSNKGIYLIDLDSDASVIKSNSLGRLFKQFSETIQCVFLDSCYSESQALTISEYVPYVIGTKYSIADDIATEFSSFFYKSIGMGESIEISFEKAKNHIQISHQFESELPLLKNKKMLSP